MKLALWAALTAFCLVMLACGGGQSLRVRNAQRAVEVGKAAYQELDAAMLTTFQARVGSCDTACLARWMAASAALEGARQALLTADHALRAGAAHDEGQIGAVIGCAGAAFQHAIKAAEAVGVQVDSQALRAWRDWAGSLGTLCRMSTGTVGRGSAQGANGG